MLLSHPDPGSTLSSKQERTADGCMSEISAPSCTFHYLHVLQSLTDFVPTRRETSLPREHRKQTPHAHYAVRKEKLELCLATVSGGPMPSMLALLQLMLRPETSICILQRKWHAALTYAHTHS